MGLDNIKDVNDLVDYIEHPAQASKERIFLTVCDKQWDQLMLIDKQSQHWYWCAWWWLCNPFGWRY